MVPGGLLYLSMKAPNCIDSGADASTVRTREATGALKPRPPRPNAATAEGYDLGIDDGPAGGSDVSRPSPERAAIFGERQPGQPAVQVQGGQLSLWLLRGGLAFVFTYAAVAMAFDPEAFVAYVPEGLRASPWADRLLFVISGFEALLAVGLLWRRFTSVAALMSAAMMVGIIAFNLGSFDVLFRNVAIGCAALSLALQTRSRLGLTEATASRPGAPTDGE